jgi:hypothetical protein
MAIVGRMSRIPLLVMMLLPFASFADPAVKVYDFSGDTIEGARLAPADPKSYPEIWAHVRKGELARARDEFATALARRKEVALVRGWLTTSVLAGDEPGRVVAALDPARFTADERVANIETLCDLYVRFGEPAHQRACRTLLVAMPGVGARSLLKLHRASAMGAAATRDWKTFDVEIDAMLDAAARAGTAEHRDAAELVGQLARAYHIEFEQLGDRSAGAVAKALYTRALNVVADDETRKLAAALDAALGERPGNAAATGSLDKGMIRRYIKRRFHEAEACFERALVTDGDTGGTAKLRLTISTSGTVANVAIVERDPKIAKVADCVAARARTWTFPAGDATVNVFYPITFRAEPA